MARKTVEQELAAMILDFPAEDLISFLQYIVPIFELYDIEDESDWVEDEVGEDATHNVRILRTFYLMSRLADTQTGMLARLKMKYGGLWKRMEKEARQTAQKE